MEHPRAPGIRDRTGTLALALPCAVFLLLRVAYVLAAADVFFYAEELEKGTAAKALIDRIAVPYATVPYHPYEGGGFVVSHLKALAFLLVGENLLAHKLVALVTSSVVLACGIAFCRRHLSPRAAVLFAWLFALAPVAFQKLSLLSLGIHFEALVFVLLVLDRGLRLVRATGPPSAADLVTLGLIGGFGTYFSYQVVLPLAWVVLVALARRRGLLAPWNVGRALAGFAVGFLPWILMAIAWGPEQMLDIHGQELVPGDGSGLRTLVSLCRSILRRPAPEALRILLLPGAALLLGATWAWRGSRGERGVLLYLAGFVALWGTAWVRGGYVMPELAFFLSVQRLAPPFAVALLILAGALDRLLRGGRVEAWSGRAALAVLLVAGGLAARTILAEGRIGDLRANLAFLWTTKGYHYDGYVASIVQRDAQDDGIVERLRPWLDFREPDRSLLVADLVRVAFARDRRRASWAKAAQRESGGASGPLGIVDALARELGLGPEDHAAVLLGAGQAIAREAKRDLDRAFELVQQEPPERRAALAEALGRYGRDLADSPERLLAQVEHFVGRPGAEPVLEGLGYRVFRRFVVLPYGGARFIAKPSAALEWVRGLAPAAVPAMERGFQRAWEEYRLSD